LLTVLLIAACDSNGDTPTPRTVPDADYTTTESGLQYYDFTIGEGAEATRGSDVTVHYRGWRTDSTQFDASYDRDRPFTFTLGAGQVIQGWDEGVAGMKVGGERQLVIPPELGYGSSGAGNVIPPNATLIFEVELLEVN
jgi:FKBP-type peptidyl-prolyl cis-trans isomerase